MFILLIVIIVVIVIIIFIIYFIDVGNRIGDLICLSKISSGVRIWIYVV